MTVFKRNEESCEKVYEVADRDEVITAGAALRDFVDTLEITRGQTAALRDLIEDYAGEASMVFWDGLEYGRKEAAQ